MKPATDFKSLLNCIDEDLYQRLKTAVEIGRWPNGKKLSDSQKALTLQAIIAYELKNLPEQNRTGYIPSQCSSGPSRSVDSGNNVDLKVDSSTSNGRGTIEEIEIKSKKSSTADPLRWTQAAPNATERENK